MSTRRRPGRFSKGGTPQLEGQLRTARDRNVLDIREMALLVASCFLPSALAFQVRSPTRLPAGRTGLATRGNLRTGPMTMKGFPPAKKARQQKQTKKKSAAPAAVGLAAVQPLEDERAAHMQVVSRAVAEHAPHICDGLARDGMALVDGFLPPSTVRAMRGESEGLYVSGAMQVSESTRWDEEANEVVSYQKRNVLTTGLQARAQMVSG